MANRLPPADGSLVNDRNEDIEDDIVFSVTAVMATESNPINYNISTLSNVMKFYYGSEALKVS